MSRKRALITEIVGSLAVAALMVVTQEAQQAAVRWKKRRALKRLVDEMNEEFGPPSEEDLAWAKGLGSQ